MKLKIVDVEENSPNSGLVKILECIIEAEEQTCVQKKSDFEKRKEGKEIAQNRFIHTGKKEIVHNLLQFLFWDCNLNYKQKSCFVKIDLPVFLIVDRFARKLEINTVGCVSCERKIGDLIFFFIFFSRIWIFGIVKNTFSWIPLWKRLELMNSWMW